MIDLLKFNVESISQVIIRKCSNMVLKAKKFKYSNIFIQANMYIGFILKFDYHKIPLSHFYESYSDKSKLKTEIKKIFKV